MISRPVVTGVVVAVQPSATVVPTNDPPTATSGCDESGGELTLITIVEKLKAELGIEGTVIEVVEIATMTLGADPTGSLSLVQRARACHFIVFGSPPEASSKSTAAIVPMGQPQPPQHQIVTPVAAFGAMGTAVVTVQPGAAASVPASRGDLPKLRLVPADSPDAVVLDPTTAATLRQGRAAPLWLASPAGVAIAPKWSNPRNAFGQWEYIELGVGAGVQPLTVALDGRFLVWNGPHGEMVFDVSMWKMTTNNNLVLVKAAPGNPGGPTRMSKGIAGRDFVLQPNGTIAPANAQHLCLGSTSNLTESAPGARVVLLGKAEGCSCLPGRCKGFDETLRSKPWFVAVPDELAARGVTPAEWRAQMEKLAAVQAKNGVFDCCRCAILLLCWPCIPPSPWWWACMCLPWSKWDPFQIAMHEWLSAINRDLLRPKGMYAKAFCFKETGQSGEYWKDGTLATINIALTPQDVSRLEAQPVFQQSHSRDPNWGCWCLPAHAGRAV